MRARSGLIDSMLAGLYAAIAAPHRAELTLQALRRSLDEIASHAHRSHLAAVLEEIRDAAEDPVRLRLIERDLESWQQREFPTR